eukprot:1963652-Rhodomonas_salina.3
MLPSASSPQPPTADPASKAFCRLAFITTCSFGFPTVNPFSSLLSPHARSVRAGSGDGITPPGATPSWAGLLKRFTSSSTNGGSAFKCWAFTTLR